jgi:ABC-2 type transport system ATP-binding protein
MIETEDLSKAFGSFQAVDGISIRVEPGQVLALLGPNGSGKTTTVRLLSSVLQPTRGWARVAGYDVVQEASQVRASVGVLNEHHGFYWRMRSMEYLEFFGQLYGLDLARSRKRASKLMEDFGLAEFQHLRLGHFSRGMQQKLALARALLHDPPVLLLDEPTSALDPESAFIVRDTIQQLRSSERAIVICTHNLAEAEKLADKIAIIRRGRIVAQGSPEALKRKWLGPPEYEVQLAHACQTARVSLPGSLEITARGDDWLRFRPDTFTLDNPRVLKSLLEQGLPVTSIIEVPRSLEQIYLEVINLQPAAEEIHAG